MSAPTARQFGRYSVVDRLGKGGMGDVFLVLDREGRRLYALKALREDLQDKALPQFRSEAQLIAKLQNEHLETFREFVSGAQNYIVKEFIDGVPLSLLLERVHGPFDNSMALHIATQILEGLMYMHQFQDPAHGGAAHLVHGDLSPSNVMITFTGQVKLIDLGLSCFPRRAFTPTEPTNWLNIRYSSPSRVLNRRRSMEDDLFAFGLILWEMLTGNPYWQQMRPSEIYRAMPTFAARDPRTERPSLPEELCSLILGCISNEGFTGYADASDVQEGLNLARASFTLPFNDEKLAQCLIQLCPDELLHSRRRRNLARLQMSANEQPVKKEGWLKSLLKRVS